MSSVNAKVLLYVQLIGSIFLFVAIAWIYCYIGNLREAKAGSTAANLHGKADNRYNVLSKDKEAADMLSESYVLRPRLMLWLRQLSLSGLILLNLFVLCFDGQIGTDLQLNEERAGAVTGTEQLLYITSHLIFLGALCVLTFLDDLTNLPKKRLQQAWFPAYVIMFMQILVVFFCTGTTSSLLQLIMAVGVLTFGACCAFIDIAYPQVNPPTPEYTCGIFMSLTFSHINANIIFPTMKKIAMEFEDVPRLSDADSSHQVWKRFRGILLTSKELKLWYSLFLLVKWEWFAQGFFQFLGSSSNYITPLALERILLHITNHGRDDDSVESLIPISVEVAVVMLFIGPLLSCIGDGQNYVRGRYL